VPAISGRTILILARFASLFRNTDEGKVNDPSPWWDRDLYADRRPFLLARGRILSALREWFRRRGFLEVETPALQVSPGNEVHLHAFATELTTPAAGRKPLYLHTSPEFTCKKLLAAGEARVFSLGHVFRNRERGPLHHPEFTMLEWYRANEPYEALMEDCAAILNEAAKAAGSLQFQWKGGTADPYAAPVRLSVGDAFQKFAGIDVLSTLPSGKPHRDQLAAAVRTVGIQIADDDTWSDIFSRVLVERIEPQLGHGHAVLLDRYPLPEAAWAQPDSDPRLAKRFELYVCGVELANGFAELTDADEQRRRFEEAMTERQRRYGEQYPIDGDFLQSLAQMPPASGIALGLDRLVMLATGASRIEQVLWAPVAGDDR
jgi:lysyl-tRNA synthetase class 2